MNTPDSNRDCLAGSVARSSIDLAFHYCSYSRQYVVEYARKMLDASEKYLDSSPKNRLNNLLNCDERDSEIQKFKECKK